MITVGLIGSEASSGLSSSTTGCSLVLSLSRHLNLSLVEFVSEQSNETGSGTLGLFYSSSGDLMSLSISSVIICSLV